MTFAEALRLIGVLDLHAQPPLYATYQEIILLVSKINDSFHDRPCKYPAVPACSRIYDGCRMHKTYINENSLALRKWEAWEE